MNNNFTEALKANKTAKVTAKKSSVPTIEDVPANIQKDVQDFVELQQQKKEIEAELANVSSNIIEFTREYQDKQGFENNFNKSYNVSDVQYVSKNAYSINAGDEAQIKKLLGRNYSSFIEENFSVKVKSEVMENKKLQEELMNLLGDSFSKFFDVESSLKAKEDFDKNIYSLVKTQAKLDEVRTFIKPYKPAIK